MNNTNSYFREPNGILLRRGRWRTTRIPTNLDGEFNIGMHAWGICCMTDRWYPLGLSGRDLNRKQYSRLNKLRRTFFALNKVIRIHNKGK